MKFKKGDKVRVVNNKEMENRFELGEIRTVIDSKTSESGTEFIHVDDTLFKVFYYDASRFELVEKVYYELYELNGLKNGFGLTLEYDHIEDVIRVIDSSGVTITWFVIEDVRFVKEFGFKFEFSEKPATIEDIMKTLEVTPFVSGKKNYFLTYDITRGMWAYNYATQNKSMHETYVTKSSLDTAIILLNKFHREGDGK